MSLQVLAALNPVFKEDADLELNVVKTVILPTEGFTQKATFDVDHNIITVSPVFSGFVGIGVTIGTNTFVRNFAKTCRNIIVDVEKQDSIQDDFVHYL